MAEALAPPEPVLEIARVLVNAGYETWCVGGAVRDALLGNPHLDWDFATAARPQVVQKLFRRTIPVGIKFGTVGVLDREGRMHEVTTFRADFNADGRHAEVRFGVSLREDLARRDFTINAMAWDPIAHRLEDPFGGREDLEQGIVRAVGDADARFEEDRLRALRAIRFAARFGFSIEAATWKAMQRSAPHFGRLSAERVKQELDKTMEQVRRPSQALRLWQESGAFGTLVPALETVAERHMLATDHMAMPSGSARPLRRTLRFTALLAGLETRSLQALLKQLKFSNLESSSILSLAGNWQALGARISERLQEGSSLPDRDLRRWVARIGRLRVAAFMRLAAGLWAADRELDRPAPGPVEVRRLHRRLLVIAFRDPLEVGDLAIDGDDLRRTGFQAGPSLGRVLHHLRDFVLEEPARNTADALLAEARRLIGSPGGPEEGTSPSDSVDPETT